METLDTSAEKNNFGGREIEHVNALSRLGMPGGPGWIRQLEQQQMEGPPPPTPPSQTEILRAVEFVEKTRSALSKFAVSLNGMDVHEAIKPAHRALVDEMNGLLGKLPPLEAHKAATDANYAFNALTHACNALQDAWEHATKTVAETSKNCSAAMNAKDTAMNARETAVNGLVETGVKGEIEKRIKDGALFEKATVDGLVQQARNTGRETALCSIRTTQERRAALKAAQLPEPLNDAVLEGDDAAFAKLMSNAKDRIKALTAKGLSLNRSALLVTELAYETEANYAPKLNLVMETLKSTGAPDPDPALRRAAVGPELDSTAKARFLL